MADTYYAWSVIRHGGKVNKDEGGNVVRDISVTNFGDTVTASGLGLKDEDFQELVASGAIRTMKPPDLPKGYQGSPVQFLRDQIRAASEYDESIALAAMSQGGSYFGPSEEALLLDPELLGVEPPASEKESKKG